MIVESTCSRCEAHSKTEVRQFEILFWHRYVKLREVRSADIYTSARSGEGVLLRLLYAFMTWTWKIYLYFIPLYAVATKYSWIHFISEKHKPAQTFKLLSLKNSPLVQLHTSASDSKVLKTFLEANLQKTCHVCRPIRNVVSSTTKRRLFNADFSGRKR